MKTGFENRQKNNTENPAYKPKDGKNAPWDFRCPQYDQRSSYFVKAGRDFGVAKCQPIGHEGGPKQRVDCLPYGKVKTLNVREKY